MCNGSILLTLVFLAGQAQPQADLWPKERIAACIKALDQMRAQRLISDPLYQRKKAMLQARLDGTFKATALATKEDEEINLIQNGGFEQIDRNTRPDRSRWLWWGGWSWGGDYENFWATGKDAHSGQQAAGTRCKGKTGRIGIFTPSLPLLQGATEYELTFWAKGEGDNQLFVNFEGGASGSLREKIGPEWKQYTMKTKPEAGEKTFGVYFYTVGAGTIYLDDVKVRPLGQILED